MKFVLQHMLPRRLRYARVYLEAGSASLSVAIDGSTADWHAKIGRGGKGLEVADRDYARHRGVTPATKVLDDDGKNLILLNDRGYEETWTRPRWVLAGIRKRKERGSPKSQRA